jgi:N-acetylglucosaminyldiphosphoundecaprenol N-acetyl-beta-D-mannosaminyltransferase
MKIKILGVKIDPVTMKEAVHKAEEFLNSEDQHYMVTPNPEMIIDAQKDPEFMKILNEADLAIPDGAGLIKISKLLKLALKEKVSGVDFVEKLLKDLHLRSSPYEIIFVGGEKDSAQESREKIAKKYPNAKVVGAFRGPDLSSEKEKEETERTIEKINSSGASLLFVGFGHPRQEKWIYANLQKMPRVKLAVGVGGSFDMISGRLKRAPLFFQKNDIEWLWRFMLEPKKRLGRIYKAVIIFSYEAIKNRKNNS